MMSVAEEQSFARRALDEAAQIIDISPRVAAREAYTAMLHAAHARIAATGRAVPTTHKGVSIAIGALYRDDAFRAQSILSSVETWKQAADYGKGAAPTFDEAHEAIDVARGFIERMFADIASSDGAIDPALIDVLRARGRGE